MSGLSVYMLKVFHSISLSALLSFIISALFSKYNIVTHSSYGQFNFSLE